jgi:hypothetical protein
MTTKVYTVRNEAGQFLGTYRALNAAQALAAHKRGQAVYFSTFRSQGPRKAQEKPLTATVEA